MDIGVEWGVTSLAVGGVATLVMDAWAVLLKRAFSIPSLNYALVGRWLGHIPRGRLVHANIMQSPAVVGETAMGWIAHYAIGIAFAAALLVVAGSDWAKAPTLWPALLTGWVTLLAPFFILQPGFGFGIAASRTPQPNVARWRSFMAHTAFGLGLFLGVWLVSRI